MFGVTYNEKGKNIISKPTRRHKISTIHLTAHQIGATRSNQPSNWRLLTSPPLDQPKNQLDPWPQPQDWCNLKGSMTLATRSLPSATKLMLPNYHWHPSTAIRASQLRIETSPAQFTKTQPPLNPSTTTN